jgi:hypothetical protein
MRSNISINFPLQDLIQDSLHCELVMIKGEKHKIFLLEKNKKS